jgi:hypothetical protein
VYREMRQGMTKMADGTRLACGMCSRRSPWNGSRIVLMNWKEQAAIVARHTIKPICDRIDAVAPRTP